MLVCRRHECMNAMNFKTWFHLPTVGDIRCVTNGLLEYGIICNNNKHNVWDEITFPFLNLNCATIAVMNQ